MRCGGGVMRGLHCLQKLRPQAAETRSDDDSHERQRTCICRPGARINSSSSKSEALNPPRNPKGPRKGSPNLARPPLREPSLVSRRPSAGGFRNLEALHQDRMCTGTRTGLGPLPHLLSWPRAADFARPAGIPTGWARCFGSECRWALVCADTNPTTCRTPYLKASQWA